MKPCPKCKIIDEDCTSLCEECSDKFMKELEGTFITPEELEQRRGLEGIEIKPLPRKKTGRRGRGKH